VTNIQRLYAIFIQVLGIGVFGYLIGNVVKVLSKKDAVMNQYIENVELLTTALKRRDLSKSLQKRILHYYAYCRDEKMGYDESVFLQSLPESLKTEVALNLKKEFIEGIPLFKNASEKFIIEIALKLELTVATPGGYIFKADDPGREMFFIISGELKVLNKKEDQVLTLLKEGDFFGEIALFKNQVRSATVKAISYCNLYKLGRETFEEVISKHPEVAVQIEHIAKSRE
jgi:voltage-gated potassium channel